MRLRLKTKLVLAISTMVVTLVATLSFIYISQIVRQRVNFEYERGETAANEILHASQGALQSDLSSTPIDTTDPEAVRRAIAQTLQTDAGLSSLLESIIGYSRVNYDAAITDTQGRALLHTNPAYIDKVVAPRDNFDDVRKGGIWGQIQVVYGKPREYDVRVQLNREGTPFGSIRVGISTTLLRSELKPQVDSALMSSGIAVLVSLVLAAVLSNFALRPLETISKQLDLMTAGSPDSGDAEAPRARDEVGAVTHKIDRLGRQIRDVKEVFSALKENLDQIMSTLQDGLMLFTRDWNTVLVSASAETFLGKPRGEMLGQNVENIFSPETPLGRLVLDAFHNHEPLTLHEIETETGSRIQVSLDFIEEHGERIGALLTMRDAESVRRIENEIELSQRLAAIGRLTSGVAHEVKNPINAIVVHLEILRQKMQQTDPDTRRHMDVIGSEIHRLDRVVQMLVDFTRPVELRLTETDLRRVIDDVAMLASPDAERHGVKIHRKLPPDPLLLKVDADLVKQAILNVVLNGVQAMPEGGNLNIAAARDGREVQLTIHDEGVGIPPDIREKIFDLYFTTKQAGSGIGLAMTFRVMQLHNGSVDFNSEPGAGTTFHLHFPHGETQSGRLEAAGRGEKTGAVARQGAS